MQAKEVKDVIDAKLMSRFGWLITTAFSENPVSMKYRGVFKLYSRKEKKKLYSLNYFAKLGEKTLQDQFNTWVKKHAKTTKNAE